METVDKIVRDIKKQDDELGEGKVNKAVIAFKFLAELYFGTSFSPIEGTVKTLKDLTEGNEVNPDDVYDALGVSPYYRPEEEEESTYKLPSTGGGGVFENQRMKDMKERMSAPGKKMKKQIKDRLKRD